VGVCRKILPHHLQNITLAANIAGLRPDDDQVINDHSADLVEGINQSDLLIEIPSGHPLRKLRGERIPYREDCGHKDSQKLTSAFRDFFQGDPEERVWISLLKDGVCNTCEFGVHCENSLEKKKRGESYDNLFLGNFYDWYRIAKVIDEEVADQIVQSATNANTRNLFLKILKFKKLLSVDQIDLVLDQSGKLFGVGMKRGSLLENLNLIIYCFYSPSPSLFWTSPERNLLAPYRDMLGDGFNQLSEIVSENNLLHNRIITAHEN